MRLTGTSKQQEGTVAAQVVTGCHPDTMMYRPVVCVCVVYVSDCACVRACVCVVYRSERASACVRVCVCARICRPL